ncbi:MAG TPA: hypothetical protein VIH63_05000 [Xanthobacteraceae bacterium]
MIMLYIWWCALMLGWQAVFFPASDAISTGPTVSLTEQFTTPHTPSVIS